MKLFNKPSWLKPEINEPKYYAHLVILVLVSFFLVNQFIEPMEITGWSIVFGVLFLAIGDTIAHTLLKMD